MSEPKRLVLVVGVGRSGTSLLAGILGQLGFHIPQPEVRADDTNPKGFGEPRWVVDFHRRLMDRLRVIVFDARPQAFEKTGTVTDEAETHNQLRAWLGGELAQADAVVVKDPRVGWFLPLWQRCSDELGAQTTYITMLRHPAEILTSARRSYGTWQSDASRAAAWLNVMLQTEQGTRDHWRVFVRYEDLLVGWHDEIVRAGGKLDLPLLTDVPADRRAAVDAFVDPALHRNRVGWDELDVPEPVRDLCERVWDLFQPLAEAGTDAAPIFAALDVAHEDYRVLYREAEAISQPSATAVRPRKKDAPKAPPTLRMKVVRRIPKPVRRRLRRMAGRS
jgi:hypothetical protein